MNIKKDILWRVYLSFFFIAVFGVTIAVYAFDIIFVEGEEWRRRAKAQTTDYQNIQAVRGNIYSDDGSLLATSVPIYDLRMDFRAGGLTNEVFNANVDSLAYLFSRFFGDKSQAEYRRVFKKARSEGERYFLLKRRLSHKQLKQMRDWPLLRMGQHKGGVIVVERDRRQKPFKRLAERTIGYSINGVAPVGLEGAYDEILGGVGGKRLMQKVAGGVWIPINDENEIEPENGKDIYTTIDVNLQDVAEDALFDALVKHNAENGTAVLMEVKTGKIKAIANLTRTAEGEYAEKYNYAVGESAEPGSTIKLASLIALLEDGAQLTDSVDVEFGVTQFFDRKMKDSEPGHFEKLTLKESFEKSSNVGISKLVYERFAKKPEKFTDYFVNMGLQQPLNLQITGEGKPRIKSPSDKDWSGISLPWMSIGYETRLTPLKILCLYNAVANDGIMLSPLLVTEIRETGKEVQSFKPVVMKEKICSKKVLEQARVCLEGVVENGTARNLKNENYKVAGKTGTAQMADAKHGYRKFYKSSFVGYFPADNPKYSCIVSINGPSNGVYYGGAVAGPVFKEIADKVYASKLYLEEDIEILAETPDFQTPRNMAGKRKVIKEILNKLAISNNTNHVEDDFEWVYTARYEGHLTINERRIINGLVPNVEGMTLQDAVFLLENSGMKVITTGVGRVRRQSLMPGSRINKGSLIKLELR